MTSTPHISKPLTRRAFLRAGALSAAGLATLPQQLAAADAPGWEGLQPAATTKRVVVIGAGLAGLSAAYELTQAGHEVVVLEARLRAGGRVHAARAPFSDGLYAETGALLIPSNHGVTLDYAEQFGLPLQSLAAGSFRPLYHLQNRWYDASAAPDWPLPLTEDERTLGYYGLQERYILTALQDLGDVNSTAWPPDRLRRYDDLSFADFLREQGASPGAVALLRHGYADTWGEGIETVSALFLLRALHHQLSAMEFFRLEGGNDRLAQAFADRLKTRIRYGAPVRRIARDGAGVEVVVERHGQYETVPGDYAICTVPASVLRTLEVTPTLPRPQRRAVAELPYTGVTGVFLQFRERVWGDRPGVWSATDGPLMNLIDATLGQPGPRGVLAAYVAGAEAHRLDAQSPEARLRHTLAEMEEALPGLTAVYEGGVSKSWRDDPWARGAYAHFAPGQFTDLTPHLGTPAGRLHFAGEHTSPWVGWMQGALASGRRAAAAIAAAA